MKKRYYREKNSTYSWLWVWNEDGTYQCIATDSSEQVDTELYDDGMSPERYKKQVEEFGRATLTQVSYEDAVIECI